MSVLKPEHVALTEAIVDWSLMGFQIPWRCSCGTENPVISEVCDGCHKDVSLNPETPRDHPVFLYYRADDDADARAKLIAYIRAYK